MAREKDRQVGAGLAGAEHELRGVGLGRLRGERRGALVAAARRGVAGLVMGQSCRPRLNLPVG